MTSDEIRKAFLAFFQEKGHTAVSSSSLIPANDPTLLFTNAGMVPFKDTFLGQETRAYQRATSVQRCVRAGGKHNDLENVGYTARHHTFFEMLGNFSFGDYFKKEAIAYAWEFVTKVLQLPAEKLWITVHDSDKEAEDIWIQEIGVSPTRFSRCGDAENFWSMGDTGPCGPCTEIFYDHGPDIAGGPPGSPDAEGDRYVEIWNLVFMQYNRDKAGVLHPLPKPSVDTGMGLERITAVVQGVHSNYDIDSFQRLIQHIQHLQSPILPPSPSLCVIADHIRACSFLLADGVTPSNEGRGYVLRRIIRRAVRHGSKLGLTIPFFYTLVSPLVEIMKSAYPELEKAKERIQKVLQQEEMQFARTLEQGLRLLQQQIAILKTKQIPGEIAFKLYDTYGFPLDLTQDIAREQGLEIDIEAFEAAMQKQRALSQTASSFVKDYSAKATLQVSSQFHGYTKEAMKAKVIALLVSSHTVEELVAPQQGAVILDATPFYAQSGGQVGDTGVLTLGETLFIVEDTQKEGNAIVHYGKIQQGRLQVGQEITAEVDSLSRAGIRIHHTATHLLHAALRKVLGQHVVQKGSLVTFDRARFDFAHFTSLSTPEIQKIEELINEQIRANIEVITEVMPIEKAKQEGAMALFDEKYEENVRVLNLGAFSKELCGGTHARRTGDIGLCKIIAEYGIASGVRRIEMRVGAYALQWMHSQLNVLEVLAKTCKISKEEVSKKVVQLLEHAKQQEKTIAALQTQLMENASLALRKEAKVIGDIEVLVQDISDKSSQTLKATMDTLQSHFQKAILVLYVIEKDKIQAIAHVSKALIGKVPSAVELVTILCGKGGGRADLAQGGGLLTESIETRLTRIWEKLQVLG